MYVTLERAKQHCNVEIDDDNDKLALYIDAAEAHVQKFLGQDLSNYLVDNTGDSVPDLDRRLNPAVEAGILMYVADLYENRQVTVTGTIVAENPMASNILHFWRVNLGV